jgi:hypothetical protein
VNSFAHVVIALFLIVFWFPGSVCTYTVTVQASRDSAVVQELQLSVTEISNVDETIAYTAALGKDCGMGIGRPRLQRRLLTE